MDKVCKSRTPEYKHEYNVNYYKKHKDKLCFRQKIAYYKNYLGDELVNKIITEYPDDFIQKLKLYKWEKLKPQ
jgi:hypothetical protein